MGLLDATVLCAALLGSCMLLRGRFRLAGAAAVMKLFLIAVFAVMIDVPSVYAVIVRLNVDQGWYGATAHSVADAVSSYGLFIDYSYVVGNQNFLYNAILGLYTAANGSLNPLSWLLLNFAVYAGIIFFCLRIKRTLGVKGRDDFFALALFLLPSLNIYSMLMLRDLLIGLALCAFIDALLARRYLSQLLLLGAVFALRNQFAFILFFASALEWYIRNRKTVALPLRLSAIGLGSIAVLIIAAGGRYGYLLNYFNLSFLYGFFSWVPLGFLGLDFIVQDRSVLAASFSSLVLYRLISPDTFLLPLFFLVSLVRSRSMSASWKRLSFVLCVVLFIYCFGYYSEYKLMFVRLFIPFYALFFVLSYDTIIDALHGIADKIPWRILRAHRV
jgi:hypothetical protein